MNTPQVSLKYRNELNEEVDVNQLLREKFQSWGETVWQNTVSAMRGLRVNTNLYITVRANLFEHKHHHATPRLTQFPDNSILPSPPDSNTHKQ